MVCNRIIQIEQALGQLLLGDYLEGVWGVECYLDAERLYDVEVLVCARRLVLLSLIKDNDGI